MSAPRQDILNDKGDFPLGDVYLNGVLQDTAYGNSDAQHVYDLILITPGAIKEYPTIGFNVKQYQNAEVQKTGLIEQSLTKTMQSDKYTVKKGCVQPQLGGGFIIDTSFISPNY